MGGLAGVTPRVDVGPCHCGGSEPACTPAWTPLGASGVAGKDSTTTCRVAGTSGGNC